MERLRLKSKDRAAGLLFEAAFLGEVVILCLNAAGIEIPYRGRILQLLGILFGVKILLTHYTKREWALILCVGALSLLPMVKIRDTQILQTTLMLIAAKDADREKLLRIYAVMLAAAMLLMAVLSGAGVLGNFVQVADFDRGGTETRYCFGFSHPNVFYSHFLNLTAIGLTAFWSKIKGWYFLPLTALNVVLLFLSGSRTGFVTVQLLVVVAFAVYIWPQMARSKWFLGAGLLWIAAAVGLSYEVVNIYVIRVPLCLHPYVSKLDDLLTGRIGLAAWARMQTWTYFPQATERGLVDMGFVNVMANWGIVLGSVYVGLSVGCFLRFYRKEDMIAQVILLVYTLFTVFESHAFSMYFVGNLLFLLMLGWGKEQKDVPTKESDTGTVSVCA